ncbi:MAG: hypothetical protein HQL31_08910 [Planctomycetes bacterium]|nr:hypothetical protein [Planctomycetota bacterium]
MQNMTLDEMMLSEEIELAGLDTRFESLKTRDPSLEGRLHAALLDGVEVESFLVTRVGQAVVLLDGFKRLRSMKRLNWGMAPCTFIAEDEAAGIVELLKRAQGRKMNLYEEAGFVLELHRKHGMHHGRIASLLGRSKGWVSMRVQFLSGMSEATREAVRSGAFPLHAWMYSVRPFMRVNGGREPLAEEFVRLMGKEQVSLREIGLLARAWFEGGQKVREEIRQGNGGWVLKRLWEPVGTGQAMSAAEQQVFKRLTRLEELIREVCCQPLHAKGETSAAFRSQASLVCSGLLANLETLKHTMEKLHAEC